MHNQPVNPVATNDVNTQSLRSLQLDVESYLVLTDQRIRLLGDRVFQLSSESPASNTIRNPYTM